jgi:hypothetical protein
VGLYLSMRITVSNASVHPFRKCSGSYIMNGAISTDCTNLNSSFFLVSWSGVRLSPLGTSANILIDDECGVVGGMRIGRGNRSTRRKPALVPLCLPQIPHDLTWDRTRAAAVGNRRLTVWAMARPDLNSRSTWTSRIWWPAEWHVIDVMMFELSV